MADLQAQIAANSAVCRNSARWSILLGDGASYMGHVQDNAEESVRRVIDVLTDGHFTYPR